MLRRAGLVVSLVLSLVSTSVIAQPDDDGPGDPPKVTHPEGAYAGAAPGQRGNAQKRKPRAGSLSWIGFVPKEGGAQLFFQSPSQFSVSQRVEGRELVVLLEGLRRVERNVNRPLETRFFATGIARVRAKVVGGKKRGVEVRILYKDAAGAKDAAIRTASEGDGFHYAYLDLASPGAAAADEAPRTAPEDELD